MSLNNKYILIITLHADPAMTPGYDEWGGTHTYMRELLDEFTKYHKHCILVTRHSMRYLPSHEIYSDYCEIYRLQNGSSEPMSKLKLHKYHEYNIKKIKEIINKQHAVPQIIHSVYWNSGRVAMELSDYYHIPFVHSVISNARGRVARGAKSDLPEREHFEQLIYNSAQKILCVSQDEKSDLIKYYHTQESKLLVSGQFIDDSFINPAHDKNNFPRINSIAAIKYKAKLGNTYNTVFNKSDIDDSFWLYKAFTYFGRMDFNKGISVIFDAWYILYKKYGHNCPPLWMVGGSLVDISIMRKKVKSIIPDLNQLEKMGNVVWWGYLDFKGLSTVLLKTLVVVMHSLYEPGGRVAVEAMSEQIPVIATPNGFANDIIIDWHNGFLVDYGNKFALAQKMEFFLRQPLLSDSLGKNAAISAQRIVREWSFTERHFSAYGITGVQGVNTQIEIPNNDISSYDFSRTVNLYPYFSLPLSNQYIIDYFKEKTGQNAYIDENYFALETVSNIKRISTINGYLIVKQYIARMAVSPLINPILNNELGKQPLDSFGRELHMYRRINNKNLVLYDNLHHLLYLKELKTPKKYGCQFFKDCIDYLMNSSIYLTEREIEKTHQFFIKIPESANILEIESYIISLREAFPEYYFGSDGFFSPNLCWKIALLLIKYNTISFTNQEIHDLRSLQQLYASDTYPILPETFEIINLDTDIKHFLYDNKKIEMIDYEKASIGPKEVPLSGFLYDFYKNKYLSFYEFVDSLDSIKEKNTINIKMLISMISYHAFYNYIYNKTLHQKDINNDLDFMKRMRGIYNECTSSCSSSR